MASFEQEVRDFLTMKALEFDDHTGSLDQLDFTLRTHDIHFDVKEKKQHIKRENWKGSVIPEEYFFILDDLAARKILLKSPRSFLLIRDCTSEFSYFVFSIVDLLCMPKLRVRRPLGGVHGTAFKGKWYIDLRHGIQCPSLNDAVNQMIAYPGKFSDIFKGHIDCWGNYSGENIQTAGTVRKSHHWTTDLRQK